MFKKVKVSITVKKGMQILAILNQIKVEDSVLEYVFTMNAKVLAKVNEDFNDEKSGLILLYATEKDGVLLKTGDQRDYVYSKENQTQLEKSVNLAGEKIIEIELLQIDITNRPKAQELQRVIKTVFMDNIFTLSAPKEKEELKPILSELEPALV